jgi:transcription elongation factor Elf1
VADDEARQPRAERNSQPNALIWKRKPLRIPYSKKAMEHFFGCPYCGERISMVLDTSVKGQTYVEDCEVCCRPIEVHYTMKDDEVRHFEGRAM